MKTFLTAIMLALSSSQLLAQTSVIEIWPTGKVPGKSTDQPESDLPARPDGVRRITNVSTPTLAIYPASKKNSPAVIVLPGGGYSYVSYSKEGTEIAAWLNANGMTALVLKYRVPNQRDSALADAQRSIRLARTNAKAWNIDPKRIGVMGFSAGGHASVRASTNFGNPAYAPIDPVDKQNARPDFAMLIYPAYLEKEGAVVPEVNLKAKIPPTLLVVAEDDKSYVLSSKVYASELNKAKIPNKLLIYATGGHGFGLRSDREAKVWPDATIAWLREIKILNGRK
ncbi:MAG: alpha/beta hydrolase [Pyrinomonadaceae bacterium]